MLTPPADAAPQQQHRGAPRAGHVAGDDERRVGGGFSRERGSHVVSARRRGRNTALEHARPGGWPQPDQALGSVGTDDARLDSRGTGAPGAVDDLGGADRDAHCDRLPGCGDRRIDTDADTRRRGFRDGCNERRPEADEPVVVPGAIAPGVERSRPQDPAAAPAGDHDRRRALPCSSVASATPLRPTSAGATISPPVVLRPVSSRRAGRAEPRRTASSEQREHAPWRRSQQDDTAAARAQGVEGRDLEPGERPAR